MIFAELEYDQHYSDVHQEMVEYLTSKFANVQYGLQGDSWIWINENNEKVTIDTFYSMKHQIKAASAEFDLTPKVIDALKEKYEVIVYNDPKPEPHE